MLKFKQYLTEQECTIVSRAQLKKLETLVDRMFEKFGIDFNFTNHFHDRLGDDRNNPCIKLKELGEFFQKIYMRQGRRLKNSKNPEVVLVDIQKDLNMPVVLKYNRQKDELEVRAKTIMRKRNFDTKDDKIGY